MAAGGLVWAGGVGSGGCGCGVRIRIGCGGFSVVCFKAAVWPPVFFVGGCGLLWCYILRCP